MKRLAFLFFIALLLSSCLTDLSQEDVAKSQINDILMQIKDGFLEIDVPKIMSVYDNDYLHKGKNKSDQRFIWQDRLTSFSYLELIDIKIDINGDFAVAYFLAEYSKYGNKTTFIEPDDIGDMSYFRRVNGQWQVYGDQEFY
ncbi:MAG: hypothetical protein RBS16_01510 [Candidatus Cloacimonadales bacterium]|jgi:hypothetical protein|nr:hypothetical protein [Candidatus Cloacimonadota bacterium]MDD2651291.1 hypothetical protein [Candidatus Cloacimonadota bacterium]MDD3501467.1 hypothetical protein [Candidatus Cloacimonadota bacterium]MDX9976689.1 hypothetical protein [Candidatus Cloacimonadales bacterium]